MQFSKEDISKIWQKAEQTGSVANENNGFRKDECGAWIKFADYGNRNSNYGWEIDHITPVANGGQNYISNLRPLHWKNNAAKSDGRLVCAVISQGVDNVLRR